MPVAFQVVAVDQVGAFRLDDRREAVGVPLALAIAELQVDCVFDLGERLQLGERVLELRHGPGVVDLGRDAHAGLFEVGLVAPDGEAGIELPKRVELAIRRIGALRDQRGDLVVDRRFGDEVVERREISGPGVVRVVRPVEVEKVGKVAGKGGCLHLLVIGALRQEHELRLHVGVHAVPFVDRRGDQFALAVAAAAVVPDFDHVLRHRAAAKREKRGACQEPSGKPHCDSSFSVASSFRKIMRAARL